MLDEFRSTNITWDKATRRIYSPITANASDSNGRKLNIQVVNSGQVENLTGATLHLYWETKDKTQYGLDAFTASDISKGEFEIFYTTGMLSNVGELNATLVLVDSTGKVVSDWFKITVTRGINEGAIESENSFSSLTQALIDISNLEQNYAPRLNDLTAQLQQTATKAELSGVATPLVATLVSQMKNVSRIYVYKGVEGGYTNGNWYYHNGTAWVSGGVYQSTGIGGASVGIPESKTDLLDLATNYFPDFIYYEDIHFIWDSVEHKLQFVAGSESLTSGQAVLRIEPSNSRYTPDNKFWLLWEVGYDSFKIFYPGETKPASYWIYIPLNAVSRVLHMSDLQYSNTEPDHKTNVILGVVVANRLSSPLLTGTESFAKVQGSLITNNTNNITGLKNDVLDEINKVEYAHKFIYYNPADYSLNIIGDDIEGDTRICIFYKDGVTYTVNGLNGNKKILGSNTGNAWIVINKNTIDANNITINDMSIVTTVLSNHIALAHLIWNSAVNSKIIKNYKDLDLTTSDLPALATTGEQDTFLKGMLSTNKQVFKLAVYGDSIFASGHKDITFPDENGLNQYEQPPRYCHFDGFTRMIYDYLNFNKPIFRNSQHSDWTYTGDIHSYYSNVMPNNNTGGVGDLTQFEQLRGLKTPTGNDTAQISLTGKETVVFVFEGGTKGDISETGKVNITVSVNGGAFTNPSTVLQGKLSKKGYGDTKVYDSALDVFDTSITQPETLTAYNKYCPMVELTYNGLVAGNTYTFKITRISTEKEVFLWGCYYFTGQTLIVHNESKPGFSWTNLSKNVYTDLVLTNTDYVILEAPMYHDWNLNTAKSDATNLLNKIKGYGIQVGMTSCPPGGVIPIGRQTAILGDENGSSYWAGQDFYKYYQKSRWFNTTNITGTRPALHDIYNVTINSITYNLEVVSQSGVNTRTYFQVPDNFPETSTLTFPLTFTFVSGNVSSQRTIVYSSVDSHFTMEQHRTAMSETARKMNVSFIDVFQAFLDVAKSVGETLATPAYDMDSGHPLYQACVTADADNANYPTLSAPYKMNYMTNFFDTGDGHHLAYNAHPVIFELIKNQVLKGSVFKE